MTPKATQAAREKAERLDVDLSDIDGSGEGGKVVKSDVSVPDLQPVETHPDARRKDVFKCPVEGCRMNAIHGPGREYDSAEEAREAVASHIENTH